MQLNFVSDPSLKMTASAVCLPFSMSVIPDGTRTPISGYDTTTYEQSRRQVSSVVVL